MNDLDLLRSYVQDGSQAAFTELVHRHAALVYSTARRILSDGHLAEDVTQQVFALFAQKARALGNGTIVSGWLYRSARNVALQTSRREGRRQHREQAAAQSMSVSRADADWQQLEPLLDDAMARLRRTDHDAIVLRYFERKTLKEVGDACGWSEDAAQKRVARALDRLHRSLVKRGAVLPIAAVGLALGRGTVQSAPAGLAIKAASAGALAANLAGLNPSWLNFAAKLKLGATMAGLAALSIALLVVCRQNVHLRRQIEQMRVPFSAAPGTVVAESNGGKLEITSEELRRFRLEHLELLALRGRVTQLAKEAKAFHGETQRQDVSEGKDSVLFTAASTNRVKSGSTLLIGAGRRRACGATSCSIPSFSSQAMLNGRLRLTPA